MKNFLFILLAFITLLVSCQKQEQSSVINEASDFSQQKQILPNYTALLDISIVKSEWWRNTPDQVKHITAMEIAGSKSNMTFYDLQKMKQDIIRSAQTIDLRGKGNTCDGFPAPNPEGNVDLSSQADVDAFGALNCKNIIGRLRIVDTLGPDPICDLTPLRKIKSVGSSLNIYSDCLTSLDGLDKIKSVGELGPFGFVAIDGNNLTDISALSGLKIMTGSLNILSTENLVTTSDAFARITKIGPGLTSNPVTSQYVVNIDSNDVLADLSGLANIQHIENSLFIVDNGALENLDDLEALEFVGEDIGIVYNANLLNVDKLADIPTLSDDLFVFENPALTDCCGLYNLLCADPPLCSDDNVGDAVIIFGNGAGCEVTDIVFGGPCN